MSMNSGDDPTRQSYSGYPPPVNTYPPQGSYNQGGFDAQGLVQRWRAVLMPPPTVATFDTQQPGANWSTIWISLFGLGVLTAITNLITNAEYHRGAGAGGSVVGAIIGAPLGFFIGAGILFLIAKILGGTGSFLNYAFLLALVDVPIQAIANVAGIIPVIGGLIGFVAGIYGIILAIYATASAHRLSLGRSTAVVLIPSIVAFLLFIILIIIAAAFLVGLGLAVPGR